MADPFLVFLKMLSDHDDRVVHQVVHDVVEVVLQEIARQASSHRQPAVQDFGARFTTQKGTARRYYSDLIVEKAIQRVSTKAKASMPPISAESSAA